MNEIEPTVIIKRPAEVVHHQQALTLTAPYHAKADLVAAIKRQARRGEIRPLDPAPRYNPDRGCWEQRVIRLYPPAPTWIKPAIIVGIILIVLALLAALAWWVLTALTPGALAILCLAALGALAGLTRAGKRQTVTIVNNNYVRMR